MDIPNIRYKQEEVVNLSLLDEISIFHTKEATILCYQSQQQTPNWRNFTILWHVLQKLGDL
jgi:hypothetical protein